VTRRGLILFIALGIAWGIPYLFIKIAVAELEPAMVVLARSGLAAVLLLPLALFRHEIAPVLRRWKPMLAYTVVEIVLP
jgi:drug/metabolite transporter (DMT)-like permease